MTWYRFVEVLQHVTGSRRLFRASAPNYDGGDSTQRLTPSDIPPLQARQITRIISLNEYSYTAGELQLLSDANITYLHLPVRDFTAPTIEQIERAVRLWGRAPPANLLVHCGYGHGRTGTLITALQLWMTNGHLGLDAIMQDNHVEREVQREVLRQYQCLLFEQRA